jgi:LacI family transcriptional regulator, repressor for deo operon, udp, cdd, tsx, nupC, and nupG
MAVTQGDVALRAGVARKTVSNVISGYPHVRAEVRQRVLAAIDELGYQPNRAAQILRTGRSGVIGLAVPELDVPYFAELTRLVLEAADKRGLTLLVIQTLGELERERAALSGYGRQLIDGLIYSPIASDITELAARDTQFPVVLLGEQIPAGPNHVGIDNVAAARAATEHLVEIGCRRIAFVGAGRSADSHMADLRLSGFRDALEAAGRPVRPEQIRSVQGYHREHGAQAVRVMLDEDGPAPDGLFCANDLLAQGAMRALHERGLPVPDDVAVVGFDDIDESHYSVPSLTSISPDKEQIAETAVAILMSLLDDGTELDHDTLTSYSLQVRESTTRTGAPKHGAKPRRGGARKP